jgi:DNA-binding beta-propeller fold protein YncE
VAVAAVVVVLRSPGRPAARQARPGGPVFIYVVNGMAFAPDGVQANAVIPVSTATNKAGKPILLPSIGHDSPSAITITPDGKTVYAATRAGLIPVSTATGKPGRLIRLGFSPSLLTITP